MTITNALIKDLTSKLSNQFNLPDKDVYSFFLRYFNDLTTILTLVDITKITKNELCELACHNGISISTKDTKQNIFQALMIVQKQHNSQLIQKPVQKQSKPSKVETQPISKIEDQTFTSLSGKQWTFGKLIGSGAFGNVYREAKHEDLVIKYGNIFSERNVLMKLQPKNVDILEARKILDSYGIPLLIDSGKLRLPNIDNSIYFIVIPNYGVSLQSLIKQNLETDLVNDMIRSMLNALSYLNLKTYMHLDVKPENIMLNTCNMWYLIDFGMAQSFRNGVFQKDPKHANNGSPWYMARDAHIGLMSPKCDLESLVYTMIECDHEEMSWFRTKNLKTILEQKILFFDEFPKSTKAKKIPVNHIAFMNVVNILTPETVPQYEKLKNLF